MGMEDDCKKVIKEAGGPAKVARALGDLTSQAVSQWKRIPLNRVRKISELTGIPAAELRPDLAEAFAA